MPEYQIVGIASDYNIEKLDTELRGNQFFNGLIIRGDDVYTLLDNVDQTTIDSIDAIVANHSSDMTSEQLSQLAEAQISLGLNHSKRVLHLVAPLYQQRANDLTGDTDVSIDIAYANIRNVIDKSWNTVNDDDAKWIERYLRRLCLQHHNIDYDTEPVTDVTAYQVAFLVAIYELIDSINAQYKF